jgi:hypothetical protein
MITVFILASRHDERHVRDLWMHTVMLRRQMAGVMWANPLYVEDMVNVNALVPVQQDPYIVIGGLSPVFVSSLLDEPALREMIEGAYVKIPFIISSCGWNEYPCPFADKVPLIKQAIAEQGRMKDSLLTDAVRRLRDVVIRVLQEA